MTDTDALEKRIAQAMREEDGDVQHGPDAHPGYYEYAAAVLPIVEAEVRAAKAEAWDEGYMEATSGDDDPLANPYRYETRRQR